MALQTGINIIGKLIGHRPTERNPQYFQVGIQVSTPDGFGGSNDETYYINAREQHITRLANQLNTSKGRLVIINVLTRAVNGRNGAFVSYDLFASSEINPAPGQDKPAQG